MKIDLVPWITPNFISAKMPPGQRQDGFREGPKWELKEVDADVLSEMCDTFRAEIFRKAGKTDPRVIVTRLTATCGKLEDGQPCRRVNGHAGDCMTERPGCL